MAKKKRPILVCDLFCGAGGSSSGARIALERMGLAMKLVALNHWDIAISTHSINHPDAIHYREDIGITPPRELVPEGYLDLLMASPSCTYFSNAYGDKPVNDQQRSQPDAILDWLEQLRVDRLMIENVPEFVNWGPCDPDAERPYAERKGEFFQEWVGKIQKLGYEVEWRILVSADFGGATTRKRFFLFARRDGKPIVWPSPTHSKTSTDRMFALKPWRAAREIIDWSIRGISIFDRPAHGLKELKPNTLRRIAIGLAKHGGPMAGPFLVVLRRHCDGRGIDLPLPAICAAGNHLGLAVPSFELMTGTEGFLLGQQSGSVPRSVEETPMTVAAGGAISLTQPHAFVIGQQSNAVARSVDTSLPTVACEGKIAVAEPHLTSYYGNSTGGASVDEPLDTLTCRDRFGLVSPFVFPVNQGSERMGGQRSVGDPLPTLMTAEFLGMVAPALGLAGENLERVVEINGQLYRLDILYRMLQPHELAAAMGFIDDETGMDYQFVGNKKDVTRQIGNAVEVRTAAALVGALCADLAGAA
jgi:DNA (cytosine-5)-methyltransferase 1